MGIVKIALSVLVYNLMLSYIMEILFSISIAIILLCESLLFSELALHKLRYNCKKFKVLLIPKFYLKWKVLNS